MSTEPSRTAHACDERCFLRGEVLDTVQGGSSPASPFPLTVTTIEIATVFVVPCVQTETGKWQHEQARAVCTLVGAKRLAYYVSVPKIRSDDNAVGDNRNEPHVYVPDQKDKNRFQPSSIHN